MFPKTVLIQLVISLPSFLITTTATPVCPSPKVPDSSILKDTMNAFAIGGVVPDLLPEFTPVAMMRLLYHPNPFGTVFFPGQRVPQSLTLEQPTIRIRSPPHQPPSPALSTDSDYTFIMLDPDVPSRINSTLGPARHMLATGVKLKTNDPYFDLDFPVKPLSPYFPPAPPEATGFHRYTFLLYYGQPSPESIQDFDRKYPSRYNFDLRQFVAEAGLCDPIAGTFMFTENSKDEAETLVH
ncbi:hypothetical protein MJO28_015804 [Puccinia striiformis f. sp. tritici]|uniref:Uncharacterized protein n=1 Tax=Puccinia striiformis f. sp. tritici TaxID=168172 RepID=A0ACC0DR71_9BASI|nr:hypothetical protein MJO28_015804 [Puccinia striiformis f. sp. tritici]KAI9623223.1 hypothetical protein H4Q26_014719 [Puccinia striiformis f. sp. tritici PST-130]